MAIRGFIGRPAQKYPMPEVDPHRRGNTFAAALIGAVIALGIGSPTAASATPDPSWTPVGTPGTFYAATSAKVGNDFYLFGGLGDATNLPSNICKKWDSALAQLVACKNVPAPIYAAGAAAIGGAVYQVGGNTVLPEGGTTSTVVRIFHSQRKTNIWTTAPSLPAPRSEAVTLATPSGHILEIGGWTNGVAKRSVFSYSPTTQKWKTLAPLPGARVFASGAVTARGGIYLFGGYDNVGFQNTIYHYSPTTKTWAIVGTMPFLVGGAGIARIGSAYYLVEGVVPAGTSTDTWKWDQPTNTWTQEPSIPIPAGEDVTAQAIGPVIYATSRSLLYSWHS